MGKRPFKQDRIRPSRSNKIKQHNNPESIYDDKIRTMSGVPVKSVYINITKSGNSNTSNVTKISKTLRKHQKKV